MSLFATLLAQEAAAPPEPGLGPMVVMFGLMFAIFYFLILKPQQRKEQEHQAMLARIKKNDRVLTQGGIIGIVSGIQDDEVTLRVDQEKNTRIRFSKGSIVRILGEEAGGDEK